MVTLKNVRRYFNKGRRNEIRAVDGTTLEFGSTGLVALLGPSGCGKTTLLNLIGGLDRPDGGDIFINGERVTRRRSGRIDAVRARDIGYIFQDYKLQPGLTVFENVAIALRLTGYRDKETISRRVDYVLKALGIERYRGRPAENLSGGQRQRVAIARALVKDPPVIIADEPTGNLDSGNSVAVMNILKAISRDRLVILVTHETDLARYYATRIIELKDGSVSADYQNETSGELDFRSHDTLYLGDFARQGEASLGEKPVECYGDGTASPAGTVRLILRGGNLYVEAPGLRVEAVGDGHPVRVREGVYTPEEHGEAELEFSLKDAGPPPKKLKYRSLLGFFSSLKAGFKAVGRYSPAKKVLLAGFLLAGAFIIYAAASIAGVANVREADYLRHSRSSIIVNSGKIDAAALEGYAEFTGVDYVLPVTDPFSFGVDIGGYYQTNGSYAWEDVSLCSSAGLTEDDLVAGKLPENSSEVAVDLFYINLLLGNGIPQEAGVLSAGDFVGRRIACGLAGSMSPLTVVGIVDKAQPAVYADPVMFPELCYAAVGDSGGFPDTDAGVSSNFCGMNAPPAPFALTGGRLPEAAYEVLVPTSMKTLYPLGKEAKDIAANGHKFTVTGYYESPDGLTSYPVSDATLTELCLAAAHGFTAETTDKAAALAAFRDSKAAAYDAVEDDRAALMEERRGLMNGVLAVALVLLAVSLVEMILMTRASFLSRIREVGVYRAIGVKKSDILRMFGGEIFAITTLGSLPGAAVMCYALYHLQKVESFAAYVQLNPAVAIFSLLILYALNALAGLLPVMFALRRPPARILTRSDAAK